MRVLATPMASCTLAMEPSILSVASDVRMARLRTSSATTANPRPDSPALAASMDAFNASRLVCPEISVIRVTM